MSCRGIRMRRYNLGYIVSSIYRLGPTKQGRDVRYVCRTFTDQAYWGRIGDTRLCSPSRLDWLAATRRSTPCVPLHWCMYGYSHKGASHGNRTYVGVIGDQAVVDDRILDSYRDGRRVLPLVVHLPRGAPTLNSLEDLFSGRLPLT